MLTLNIPHSLLLLALASSKRCSSFSVPLLSPKNSPWLQNPQRHFSNRSPVSKVSTETNSTSHTHCYPNYIPLVIG
ncbi:hypothetical protein BDP27DRAFT_1343253, partial [Rhodocollybia butyracea]